MTLRLALMGVAALAIAACASSPVAHIPSFAAVLDAELAAIANDADRPLASLSVLAIRDGRIVYQRQFGRRYIDNVDSSRDRPANEATLTASPRSRSS